MLLTYKDVARLLGVSERTVRNGVEDGRYKVVRISRRLVRFPLDQFRGVLPVDRIENLTAKAVADRTRAATAEHEKTLPGVEDKRESELEAMLR